MSRTKVNAYAQGNKNYEFSVAASSDNVSVGAATNQAATVAFPANAAGGTVQGSWVIGEIIVSYVGSTTPTGNLKIQDSSGTLLDVDINDNAAHIFPFDPPISSQVSTSAMTVTLGAGGSGVTGKLTAFGWLEL